AAAPQTAAAPIAATSTSAARTHLAAELDVFGAFDGPLLDDGKVVRPAGYHRRQELGRFVAAAGAKHPPADERHARHDRHGDDRKREGVSLSAAKSEVTRRGHVWAPTGSQI